MLLCERQAACQVVRRLHVGQQLSACCECLTLSLLCPLSFLPGKMRHPGAKSLWGVLRCKDPGFVDLLEGCLRWDPAERMTPQEAMNHPWLVDVREQQQGSSTYRWAGGCVLLVCAGQNLTGGAGVLLQCPLHIQGISSCCKR